MHIKLKQAERSNLHDLYEQWGWSNNRSLLTKKTHDHMQNFTRTSKIFTLKAFKLINSIEREEFPHSLYEANITLQPKPDKNKNKSCRLTTTI